MSSGLLALLVATIVICVIGIIIEAKKIDINRLYR